MGKISNLAQLIEAVETSRTNFENKIKENKKEDFLIDGIWGEWNIKDLLAHTIAWENEMIIWINQIITTKKIPKYLQAGFSDSDVDEKNLKIYAENKDRELSDVLLDFFANHQKVLNFVKSQDEDILFAKNRYKLRDDWPLWHVIGANTFWHYDEHLVDLDNLSRKEG